jgi:hypothetical protein
MANDQQSPYEYYLDLLGDWSTGVALPSLWFCTFHLDTVNCLKSTLQKQLNNYESTLGDSGWEISKDTVKYLTDGRLQYASNSLMGCVFAKEVNLPPESVNATHDGLDYGGFMAPVTVSERAKYVNFDATFLETNASFVDMVLRPWSILVGYNGFVARSKNSAKSVKCAQCDVCLLAKTGADSDLAIRKIYRFYNIAPINISRETYNHNPDGLKLTPVSFIYDGYAILEQDTPLMLGI